MLGTWANRVRPPLTLDEAIELAIERGVANYFNDQLQSVQQCIADEVKPTVRAFGEKSIKGKMG